jgi:hypothetical protein
VQQLTLQEWTYADTDDDVLSQQEQINSNKGNIVTDARHQDSYYRDITAAHRATSAAAAAVEEGVRTAAPDDMMSVSDDDESSLIDTAAASTTVTAAAVLPRSPPPLPARSPSAVSPTSSGTTAAHGQQQQQHTAALPAAAFDATACDSTPHSSQYTLRQRPSAAALRSRRTDAPRPTAADFDNADEDTAAYLTPLRTATASSRKLKSRHSEGGSGRRSAVRRSSVALSSSSRGGSSGTATGAGTGSATKSVSEFLRCALTGDVNIRVRDHLFDIRTPAPPLPPPPPRATASHATAATSGTAGTTDAAATATATGDRRLSSR